MFNQRAFGHTCRTGGINHVRQIACGNTGSWVVLWLLCNLRPLRIQADFARIRGRQCRQRLGRCKQHRNLRVADEEG